MKLTLVGAGSTYTPELVDGLIRRRQDLPVETLSLMDIDKERLTTVGSFVKRMVDASGESLNIEMHTQSCDAIVGADFVVTQIRVGGQLWRDLDCKLAMEHGLIGQETTGFAGFAKAIRTIPPILEICKTMREAAPDAWLINFTNPSGIITEAIARHGRVRAIGLCNVPINMKLEAARALGVPANEISLDYIGLNHLSWIRKVHWLGRDVTDQALAIAASSMQKNISGTPATPKLAEALSMVPSPYLKYFYRPDASIAEQKSSPKTRAEEVMEIEAELMRIYKDPAVVSKPPALAKRGGAHYSTVSIDIMSSVYNDSGKVEIVDIPHAGAVDGFPASSVMEIPAVIDATGAHPIHIGSIEPEIRGLMHQVKAYEELTIEAAVTHSYNRALLALINNPLVQDAGKAERLLDALVESKRASLR
ncbi:MAG TPA: 6-phospho-beta-glucosidase [Bacillota bacterium]|nr:6-phospho-beta-glucosidase [Bacillota bacterium]HOO30781.1 6-phospho-beta-glucosidase [Bacillota bacterium]